MLVTREEFDLVKEEQKRQGIRVEVLEDGLASLTREVAEFRQEFAEFREETGARFDALESSTNQHFTQLHKLIADGHATIVSVVMTLAKK